MQSFLRQQLPIALYEVASQYHDNPPWNLPLLIKVSEVEHLRETIEKICQENNWEWKIVSDYQNHATIRWRPRLEVGMWINCEDKHDREYGAYVVGRTPRFVEVHFDGWSDEQNEAIDLWSNRISRYNRPTQIGRATSKGPQIGDVVYLGGRLTQ